MFMYELPTLLTEGFDSVCLFVREQQSKEARVCVCV